jgi:hypothetical protein
LKGADRFFLSSGGGYLFGRGRTGRIVAYDLNSEQFCGQFSCAGRAVDLAVHPGGRLAQVTVSSGDGGSVDLIETGRFLRRGHLELPLRPVEGTLSVSPDGLWGAAVLGQPDREESSLVGWTTDPLEIRFITPLGRRGRSIAFGPGSRRLYLACPRDSEVLTIGMDTGNIIQYLRMAGRPFQVRTERRGRAVWVLCESLGNMAIVDTSRGTITASLPLHGVADPGSRIAASPEGKLAVVPAEEGVVLLNSDAGGERYGRPEDRLELGCRAAFAVWSPLGDEVLLSDTEGGAVLALDVDRGDVSMDDTSQCLHLRAQTRDGGPPNLNPLFPP